MTLSAGTVSLGVKADTKGFGSDLHNSLMGDSGILGAGKGVGGMILKGIAAVGIAAGIGSFIKTGMGEMMDASAGNAQLAAGIKSTGNAAGVTVDSMNAMASSIQNMSGQTDDSITKSQQLLLTFTNIKNNGPDKIFDQATLASANMAAKMGGDAAGSAVMLGKALNDPVKGVAALTRVGVTFTDGQKESIKSMQDMGDMAGAQKIILGELNTEFGGAAEAAGQSLPGMIERGKRAFEDLSQTMAEMLLPVLVPVLGGMVNLLQGALPHVQAFAQGFGSAFKGVKDLLIGGDFTTAFRDAFHVEEDSPIVDFLFTVRETVLKMWAVAQPIFAGIGQMFANLAPVFAPLIPQIVSLVTSFSPLSLLLKAMGPIMPSIVDAMTSLGAALGGALAAILPTVVDLLGTLAGTLGGVFAMVLPVAVSLIGQLADMFVSLMPTVVSIAGVLGDVLAAVLPVIAQLFAVLVPVIASLIPPVMQVVGALAQALGPILQAVGSLLIALLPPIMQVVTVLVAILGPVLQFVAGLFSWLVSAILPPVIAYVQMLGAYWSFVFQAIGNIVAWLAGAITTYFTAIGVIFNWLWKSVIQPVADFIGSAIRTVGDVIGTVFGAIAGVIGGAFSGVVGIVKGVVNTIIGLVNSVIGNINGIGAAVKNATGGAIDIHLGSIPKLAEGGIVPATPGGRLVRVAEAGEGEMIVPLSKARSVLGGGDGGGNGDTYNIYEAVSARATAMQVSRRQNALGAV